MGLNFRNLDDRTRALMLSEIDRDITASTLYLSDNLSEHGKEKYPELLQDAVRTGNDDTLAMAIRGHLNSHEKPRKLKTGGFSKPPVMRINAHEMLAEGEFNRFYIRAMCVRAMEDGLSGVVVFRAKLVKNARSASEQLIGQTIHTEALLSDLRNSSGIDTALGLPPGPNSGLSVQL
ncbi:hypothetical protein [Vreelandella titanicae]|uniref:hypothetical protein n=1 Tax=Vreelandella titanicae TaxID=664683 RepID=UPI0039BFA9AF